MSAQMKERTIGIEDAADRQHKNQRQESPRRRNAPEPPELCAAERTGAAAGTCLVTRRFWGQSLLHTPAVSIRSNSLTQRHKEAKTQTSQSPFRQLVFSC